MTISSLQERSYGREPSLLKQAQIAEARDASAWESKLGKCAIWSPTEEGDLQVMLDMFPPYLERLIHSKVCSQCEVPVHHDNDSIY